MSSTIVIFDCTGSGLNAVELCDALHERDVWVQDTAPHSVRMVTHWNVDRAGVEKALVELRTVVKDRCALRKEKMPQS